MKWYKGDENIIVSDKGYAVQKYLSFFFLHHNSARYLEFYRSQAAAKEGAEHHVWHRMMARMAERCVDDPSEDQRLRAKLLEMKK